MVYTTFPKPPITEAIFDIKIDVLEKHKLDDLLFLHDKIKAKYPIKDEKFQWQTGFEVKPGLAPKISQHSGELLGYLFRSSDKKNIVQSRLDGYTFNILNYNNWNSFQSEAKENWKLYCEIAKPKKITRLALRYINKIYIPMPIVNLEEYIITLPKVANKLEEYKWSNYLMKVEIENLNIKAKAIIAQTLEEIIYVNNQQFLPLIFDIDVFRIDNIDTNSDIVWQIFKELRLFKNEVFFESITEKTKELFY